ncbi:MAG: terminase family protein [Nitrospinota bacterium]|nr:terminase family protein [Nitrospinota bacterium]
MDYEKIPAVPLLTYQKLWVRDRSRFKAGMMSRQSGKTFSATLEIVDRVLEKTADGKREDWMILSRGERQAREALNEGVKRHLMAYGALFKSLEYPWAGADATYNALEVELSCGSKITALPANPDTARGFSRNVLLDEFAFHQDSRRIWAAVFPVITRRRLAIRVISTPNGKENKFHDIITESGGRWSVHITDIHQAVAQGLDVDPIELKEALGDDEAWAREYELCWLDESTAWLSYDLIGRAEDEAAGASGAYGGGPCYLGVDIGRRRDLWAAAALELVGDVLWLRELAVLRGASFAEQDAELDRMMKAYDIRRAAMDETGLGLKPVEDTQARHGAWKVEGVTFTGPVKHHLATLAKRAFEERRIRIPADDSLRRDLHKLRKSVTASGAPRFDAPAGTDGHADRAWALFLAIHAASQGGVVIEYQSEGRPGRTGADLDRFGPASGGYTLEDY